MKKPPVNLSPEALLRHQVMSEVSGRVLGGQKTRKAVEEVKQLPHYNPDGSIRELSERTVFRWLKAFRKEGVAGLEPKKREKIAGSNVLSDEMLRFTKAQKQLDPDASIPEVIRRAEVNGILDSTDDVSRTTVWRTCKRMGLPVKRCRKSADRDQRRFAYPNRMMMVISDGKYFRAGPSRLKRVALTVLDDATRYGLGIVVCASESTEGFLEIFHQVVVNVGLMITMFLDRGPGFASGDTRTVLARLNIALIHGEKAYPEGHGKIERFNQTMKQQVLRGLDDNPAVDPSNEALTLRLRHWLFNSYNHTRHESLDGQTPAERWSSDTRDLVFPSDGWERHFTISFEGSVSKDNVLKREGVCYEVPRGSAGSKVTVTRHLLEDNALSVLHKGEETRLHPVDLAANADARRGRPRSTQDHFSAKPAQTAAQTRFDNDVDPLVDVDGGFQKGPYDEQNDDND